ncbi:hypothetical protein O7607_18435 [Micromonospora sp. WMMA1949]|uniref:hypothetical protein n=1 Tax=Micromonospora sp. WMMA1949 TaxID=3015162 RepID=UPI0022B715E5|nr:hypothetical protein [Micromonospora sp. WMMA1949]MCZ7427719.1 hypothetical protein [Micromonospora sp. WMMA1949]
MTAESPPVLRPGPFLVVLLGAVVIALLLFMPIRIGFGDHTVGTSCGNAVAMDLGHWRNQPYSEERDTYLDLAFRRCISERVDRTAQSVGVLTLTLLTVMGMRVWHAARRERAGPSGGEPLQSPRDT